MDRTLRVLQRQAALGDERAGERLFLASARAGRFDDERLRLAAYLGHAASQKLLSAVGSPPLELRAWAHGLGRWGRVVAVTAGLASLRLVEEQGLRIGTYGASGTGTFSALLPTVEAWVARPCEEYARAVRARRRTLRRAINGGLLVWTRTGQLGGVRGWAAGAFAAKAATHLTGQVTTSRSLVPRELERTVWACRNALLRFGLPLSEVESGMRERVTRALLPLAFEERGGEVS